MGDLAMGERKDRQKKSCNIFTSLLSNLSIEDLVTLRNQLLTEFLKPRRQLYATLSKQA
jgi:hypothetical protein